MTTDYAYKFYNALEAAISKIGKSEEYKNKNHINHVSAVRLYNMFTTLSLELYEEFIALPF